MPRATNRLQVAPGDLNTQLVAPETKPEETTMKHGSGDLVFQFAANLPAVKCATRVRQILQTNGLTHVATAWKRGGRLVDCP